MAVNFGTILSTGLTTVVGTSAALPADVPDNCHTILITNLSAVDTILVQQGTAGGALAAASSLVVPTNGSASVVCGVLSERPIDINGATSQLIFDSTPGATAVNVTYVCGIRL